MKYDGSTNPITIVDGIMPVPIGDYIKRNLLLAVMVYRFASKRVDYTLSF